MHASRLLDGQVATTASLNPETGELLLTSLRLAQSDEVEGERARSTATLTPWERGGPTRPSNLVLLCSRHHHLLHRPGWRARLLADASFEVVDPRGRVRATQVPLATGPPGSRPPGHDRLPLAS